jgi:serine/threonine-protein kinase ATR
MDVAEFISITQQFTLPYLILWRKQDLVARVAQAAKIDVKGVCRENVTPILTVLLCRTVGDIETTTMSLLEETADEFKSLTLASLIESQILSLTPELLKVAGDTDNKEAVRPSFLVYHVVLTHARYTKPWIMSHLPSIKSSLDKRTGKPTI